MWVAPLARFRPSRGIKYNSLGGRSETYGPADTQGQALRARCRPNAVARPRLYERLDEVARRELTVVSAPAGFGKTTLLADWSRRILRTVEPGVKNSVAVHATCRPRGSLEQDGGIMVVGTRKHAERFLRPQGPTAEQEEPVMRS